MPELPAPWHAAAGDLQGVPGIVQARRGPVASPVHVCPHRIEGDASNAAHRYSWAGRTRPDARATRGGRDRRTARR